MIRSPSANMLLGFLSAVSVFPLLAKDSSHCVSRTYVEQRMNAPSLLFFIHTFAALSSSTSGRQMASRVKLIFGGPRSFLSDRSRLAV